MKKMLFILLLFLPAHLLAQEGIIIFKHDAKIKYNNSGIINTLTRNLKRIESIDGKTEIAIPLEKTFFKNTKGIYVDGYFVQYSKSGKNIQIKKANSKMMIFDFAKNTIKTVNQNHDDNDWMKPSDLENKVKNKVDKIESVQTAKIGKGD